MMVWGRSYDYKQFKETKQLTELQARETIENTIVELFTIYYNVAELIENKDAVAQTLAISKDRLIRAQYQFDYGQANKLASLNAEVDINNDSISLMNTLQELNNAKRDLNFVLGNTIPYDFTIDTEVAFDNLYDRSELLAKTRNNNIYILQVDKNININALEIKSETSAYLQQLVYPGVMDGIKTITMQLLLLRTPLIQDFLLD
ncbi:hypothetical protein JCM19274_2667 [Algibacter lectus]|uniref:Outer membrane efflux protein n=1 Tax=Algibacter lectus TaxID=221126 RepID=A0A090WSE0_9FLAO|nr:hypothetical protein JCM19274_2667 [Algibacter lectus]